MAILSAPTIVRLFHRLLSSRPKVAPEPERKPTHERRHALRTIGMIAALVDEFLTMASYHAGANRSRTRLCTAFQPG